MENKEGCPEEIDRGLVQINPINRIGFGKAPRGSTGS